MAQKKYKQTEQKSLKEVLEERKRLYTEQINQTVSRVYSSGNLTMIEDFENEMTRFVGRAILGLEQRVSGDAESQADGSEPAQAQDRRPRLTKYQYFKSRDAGLTNEQIREKFKMKSPYQMGGFGRMYAAAKKAGAESPTGN